MPRTDVCVFDTLINGKTRREIMTTGIALALAAPLSLGSAAAMPVGDDADWPEFQQWVKDAIALDAYYEESRALYDTLDHQSYIAREKYQNTEICRLDDAARAMAARPAKTERHLAMLVTFAVWSSERDTLGNFDVGSMAEGQYIASEMRNRLIKALVPRAARLLPEVPFVLPVEA